MKTSCISVFLFVIFNWYNVSAQQLGCQWLSYSQLSYSTVVDVCVDSESNTFVLGTFKEINIQGESLSSIPDDSFNIFLCKIDSSGNLVWLEHIGLEGECGAKSLAVDSDGNILITATFRHDIRIGDTTIHENNIVGELITKYDTDGNFLWIHYVDFIGSFGALQIVVDPENNIYLFTCGETTIDGISHKGETIITKFNPIGQIEWMKSTDIKLVEEMPGTNNTAIVNADKIIFGGYYHDTINFAGQTYIPGIEMSIDPFTGDTLYFSSREAMLGMMDLNGNEISAINITAIGQFSLEAITTNSSQEIYIQGRYFSDSIYFENEYLFGDNGFLLKYTNELNLVLAKNIEEIRTYGAVSTNDFNYYSSQNWDYMYVSKFDENCEFIESIIIGDDNAQPEYATSLAKYSNNDILLGGHYVDELWIDSLYAPGDPYGGYKVLIAKLYNYSPTNIVDIILENIKIYPNPASNYISITSDKNDQINLVQLYSKDAKLLSQVNKGYENLNISHLSPGMYILRIIGAGWSVNRKLIVK